MPEPSPRQVLYAMVAGGFLLVVGVLIVASAPLAPTWWTVVAGAAWMMGTGVAAWRWRRTGLVLGISLGLFVLWTIGAAVVLA